MRATEYQHQALRTEANQQAIHERHLRLGILATRLSNAVRGLSDDTGELNGAVKRWLEYGQPLDRTNLIEEVGDCLWRLAQVCEAVGTDLEYAMEANIRKLKIRYPEQYSDQLAAEHNRNRGAEATALTNPAGLHETDHGGSE